MTYAEIVFISAKTGQRLNKLFETIDMVIENQSLRIATGVVNEIVQRQLLFSSHLQTRENVSRFSIQRSRRKTANLCCICK